MLFTSMRELLHLSDVPQGAIFQLPSKDGKPSNGYIKYNVNDGGAYFSFLNHKGDPTDFVKAIRSLGSRIGFRLEDLSFVAKQVAGLNWEQHISLRNNGMPDVFAYFDGPSGRVAHRFFVEIGNYIQDIIDHEGNAGGKSSVAITSETDRTIFDFPAVRIIVNGTPEHYIQ